MLCYAGEGASPLPIPHPVTKQQFSKPVAACCRMYWSWLTAGQRSNMKIIPQLINYACINVQSRRFWCVAMVTVHHVVVLQSSHNLNLNPNANSYPNLYLSINPNTNPNPSRSAGQVRSLHFTSGLKPSPSPNPIVTLLTLLTYC